MAVGQVSSMGVFRSDQVGHSWLFRCEHSCSPYSRSPPPLAIETSFEGPPVLKPTREELQAGVKLLVKKKRSTKRKAQAPPESSLPAQGKIPKLGASSLSPPSKEQGLHQVWVRGQALPSLAEVSEVAGA